MFPETACIPKTYPEFRWTPISILECFLLLSLRHESDPMKEKKMKMKSGAENKGEAVSNDFYDWWDSLEYKMSAGNGKSGPTGK